MRREKKDMSPRSAVRVHLICATHLYVSSFLLAVIVAVVVRT